MRKLNAKTGERKYDWRDIISGHRIAIINIKGKMMLDLHQGNNLVGGRTSFPIKILTI